MDLEALRALFPVTRHYAYFNHASLGPPSTRAVAAVTTYLEELSANGMARQGERDRWLSACRARVARLLGAEPGEIAFTRNTSHGLHLVAQGLRWQPGDNIVTAQGEFSANVYPWLYPKERGIEVCFVPLVGGRLQPADVERHINPRTRLVALSFVEYWSGFRNDLERIGEICRARDVRFCVDAVQGLGAIPVDVKLCNIDFLSAGTYKWLLSPTGAGIFFCRQDRLEELVPVTMSWRSVTPGDYADYEEPLWPDARRFEDGDLNWAGLRGLAASLDLLSELGAGWIEMRVRALTDRLIDGLTDRGYPIISPIGSWLERSAIVTFETPNGDLGGLHARLSAAGVVIDSRHTPGRTSPYPDGIRVAPHCYNSEDEVDRLLDALPPVAGGRLH